MDQPWYRQYFWLLVFGGIILVIAIISFVTVYLCRSQISRSLTLRRTLKQEKKRTQDQNVAVNNRLYQSTAPPTIMLPETPKHLYDTIAEIGITSQMMYSTVKKEPVPLQQHGINSAYNGRSYAVELHIPSTNDRFSYESYDSVGHITDIDYINTDNTIAEIGITSQMMHSTVKKEPVPLQQQGINSAYNGRNYAVELHIPSTNDRFSYESYDSVGHITDIDYINTDNRANDLEYVEVLAEDDDNDYDDVEII